MQLGARATKTVPSLCLMPADDKDLMLRARWFGADGVCIDASKPDAEWDRLAKTARTMRMLPIALASSAAAVDAAAKAGARAVLFRSASPDAILAASKTVPKGITLIAEVLGADGAALRSLVGHVDAAVVPAAIHRSPDFAELAAEMDP